jgi:hypothetical protein
MSNSRVSLTRCLIVEISLTRCLIVEISLTSCLIVEISLTSCLIVEFSNPVSALRSLDFARTWWRLFQIRVLRTKCNRFVFYQYITIICLDYCSWFLLHWFSGCLKQTISFVKKAHSPFLHWSQCLLWQINI